MTGNLYTLRVRLILEVFPRGASFAEMTHHFSFTDDTAATDALTPLADHFANEGISNKWCAVRGEPIHQLVMYRRDIAARRTWVRIAEANFSVRPWANESLGFSIGDLSFSLNITETPLYRHSLGAVTVVETTENPQVTRRVYVGPFSPIVVLTPDPIPFVGRYFIWQGVGATGDKPLQPFTDSVDLWRADDVDLAVDHVAKLEDFAGDGYSVVPSWKHGQVLSRLQTQGSAVRATIKSRGVRAWMSPAVDK